jgi:hypothetical protein
VINDSARTVRVPVRMLEHYHSGCAMPRSSRAPARGKAKPGDVFSDPSKDKSPGQKGGGGRDDGGVQLLLEFASTTSSTGCGGDAAAEPQGAE